VLKFVHVVLHEASFKHGCVRIQKVNPQDNTHVKKISDKISDEVQCDMNNNLVNRSDIDRLEDAFVNALFKLEQAITNNKNEIIGHIVGSLSVY
jgi:transcriptional regulator CtsR